MKIVITLALLSCALWESKGYPYYPYYGSNVDSLSFGATDNTRGAMVLNRYYNPYYNSRGVGGGMAAFMFKPPEQTQQHEASQYYVPDRRRQTQPELNYLTPQQNEVYYPPQAPEKPYVTEQTDIADPTEKTEIQTTTLRATVLPELTEPEVEEIEEPVQKPKKTSSKRKQAKRPVEDEDEEDYPPRMPTGAFFPMFFGWGGRSSGGAPGGATAIANAYSTGKGGVSTSHAIAYGPPRTAEHKL